MSKDNLPEGAEIDPAALTAKTGFRARKPDAMTPAERIRRYRAKNGGRGASIYLDIQGAAAMLYLKKQWGFKSTHETIRVALRHLTIQTRKGLKKIELEID